MNKKETIDILELMYPKDNNAFDVCEALEIAIKCLKDSMADRDTTLIDRINKLPSYKLINGENVSKEEVISLCSGYINKNKIIEEINKAEDNFRADNMESISSGVEDSFVDGVLSAVFCIREMIRRM